MSNPISTTPHVFAYKYRLSACCRLFRWTFVVIVFYTQADMELKEITHCRLAMCAFGGMVTQAVLTNSGFPYTG